MFVTLAQSPIVTDITMIFEKLGTPGLLAAAVWYVTKEVQKQYDGRITALEQRSNECERDRIALREMVIKKLESLVRPNTDNE